MKPIALTDLKPTPGKFYLKATDREYTLRPITMDDELWMIRTFGHELQNVLAQLRTHELCRILYRLLIDEDKQDFRPVDIHDLDENGDEVLVRKGGVELLAHRITGIPEKLCIYHALMETFGISRPMMEALKEEALEKKSQPEVTPPVGEPSSISSPPSTDGPGTTSGDSPQGRSLSP
jgi:hypothetical protein